MHQEDSDHQAQDNPDRPLSPKTSATLKRKKNADAQAAFRVRRANYISNLEETVTGLEVIVRQLQDACRSARDEANQLRMENNRLLANMESLRQREAHWRSLCSPAASMPHPDAPDLFYRQQMGSSDSLGQNMGHPDDVQMQVLPLPDHPNPLQPLSLGMTSLPDLMSQFGSGGPSSASPFESPLGVSPSMSHQGFHTSRARVRDGRVSGPTPHRREGGEVDYSPFDSFTMYARGEAGRDFDWAPESLGGPSAEGQFQSPSMQQQFASRGRPEIRQGGFSAEFNSHASRDSSSDASARAIHIPDLDNDRSFPGSRSLSPSSDVSAAVSATSSSFDSTMADLSLFGPSTMFGAHANLSQPDMRNLNNVPLPSFAASDGETIHMDDGSGLSRNQTIKAPHQRTHSNPEAPIFDTRLAPSDASFAGPSSSGRKLSVPDAYMDQGSPAPNSPPLSNTLAVIKAQSFGTLRKSRGKTKPSRSENAVKVAMEVLNARGLGLGLGLDNKRRKRADGEP
ncbi:hypothetical protein BOTBODRAFT_37928 [Botryobasidium botryosum FD-172 SS1]|uniref:BZIP domain-containing protein n=1 Tax=Botryobasidium botryosum (strain FD-172 SS1) TaxID=930990 RepID=A0A067LYJ8_BOTB1|nr:hypothetical protein BOTBODRAFT_37928 [Botryobasidium botryosum FD-172 SS1]